MMGPVGDDIEAAEIARLAEAVHRIYGYDFREYAPASFRRRVLARVSAEGLPGVAALHERILHDAACVERLLAGLAVNTTAMFRDPGFYRVFRESVVPLLRTWPSVRIWHAGCSTGEEVWSMAILLHEEGLLKRARIYATDMSEGVLRQARLGIFPIERMREYTRNYQDAGGKAAFSDYYSARYGGAQFAGWLAGSAVFAQHNLASDSSFQEFHAILCRNVTIYFNDALTARVHRLLFASLVRSGVLALGSRESLRGAPPELSFETLDADHRLYRKVR